MSERTRLREIERARKLLNLAYDNTANRGERENALAAAERVLGKVGLAELKEDAGPAYLTRGTLAQHEYNGPAAEGFARMMANQGWRPIDPASEAYKDYKGNE
jgi:hypothetical protein